jgi:hypothetical protein
VVAFVTVSGFLAGPGFAAMRSYLRRTADAVWVINCSPEGHQPEVPTRVFAGVQQPICITMAVRDGSTGPDEMAKVLYTEVTGLRTEKFAQLAALQLGGDQWEPCPDDWRAPFLPAGSADWRAMPALDELLGWSGSGTMPGRTWPIGPSVDVLKRRWERLIEAPEVQKPELLAEHKTDRTVHTRLSDGLPGCPTPTTTIAMEKGSVAPPIRYGLRTLERAWVIPRQASDQQAQSGSVAHPGRTRAGFPNGA